MRKKLAMWAGLMAIIGPMLILTAAPYHDGSMPTVTRDPGGSDVLVTIGAPPEPGWVVEVQRKVFLWGWRQKGFIHPHNITYRDPQPAKRPAQYRIRLLGPDGAKGAWSRPVKFNPGSS